MREINTSTGEYKTYQIAEYHYCKIKVYDSGRILFTGSIHKMYNSINNIVAPKNGGKGFNGNDFNLVQILKMRDLLCELFNCEPKQMVFENLEIGLNIQVNFMVQKFINSLLYHNGKKFEYRYLDHYAQVLHNNYRLKIYNKGNQYGMSNEVIRIEVSAKKMIEFSCTSIRTFANVNESNLQLAYNHLLKRFDEVCYYDHTISKKGLKTYLKSKVKDYKNPRYWINNLSSNHRHRDKIKLQSIIIGSSENIKELIKVKMINKCVIINQLLQEVSV
jgi:hypothetical protein